MYGPATAEKRRVEESDRTSHVPHAMTTTPNGTVTGTTSSPRRRATPRRSASWPFSEPWAQQVGRSVCAERGVVTASTVGF